MSKLVSSKVQECLRIAGERVGATRAGSTAAILVLARNGVGDILWATGTGVPSDATDGYAKGCLFIDTDVGAGTTGLYVNVGTSSSCDFDAVSDA